MSKLTFSKEPHFDDFDSSKNYMRVLFQPKRAIQVRELNQIQSIFNNQIESFADHIFKFGSRVDAGSVSYENRQDYIRLKDLDVDGNDVQIVYLSDKNIRGATSGVTATVKHAEAKTEDDPYTIYVNYTGAGTDGETLTFIEGETLEVIDADGFVEYSLYVRCLNCDTDADEDTILPIGKGSIFSVSESTYYVYGYFVHCDHQSIVLEKYDTTPTSKIGLDIAQQIIDESQDNSLFDNALGEANFAAAGADRYKISLTLVKKDIDADLGENFIDLATVENGVLQEIVNRPQYADIMDMIARRTHDESGDYTVKPFIATPMEHLKENTTDTTGWLTAADGGLEELMAVTMSPGKAYIKGYEIEKIANFVVEMTKARDTEQRAAAVIRKKFGNYILVVVNEDSNFIPGGIATSGAGRERRVFDFETFDIYDAVVTNLSSAGAIIGTVKVKGMELFKQNTPMEYSVLKLNIVDLQMNSGKTIKDDAVGILNQSMTAGGSFGGNIEPDDYIFNDSARRIFETGENTLLYRLPYNFVKSVRDNNNPTESRTVISTPAKYYAQANVSGVVKFVASNDETFTSFNARTWFLGYENGSNFSPYTINPADITVTNTTVEIVGLAAFENYFIMTEILIANQPEKSKTLTELVLDVVAADNTTLDLTMADAYDITSVEEWDGGTYATYALADAASAITDTTANYTLERNIQDNYYGISTIDLKSTVITPVAGQVVRITFDYFLHGSTGAYFSVDSYEPTINDPNIEFTYEDIPAYVTKDGFTYNLSDALDFRPIKTAGGDFEGVDYIPSNDKNIIFDIEYYLPRRDLMVISDIGEFKQIKGESSLEPKYPKVPDNAMAIYKVDMDPYTINPMTSAKFKYVDNKRFTMKHIGEFEQRIKNLQYYVTLNLLDQELEQMEMVDGAGNDRYKNGFLTDAFNTLRSGDIGSKEWQAAINPEKSQLIPSFNSKFVDLNLDSGNSSNYQISSNIATLTYTHKIIDEQLFASKDISVNPFFITSFKGNMSLSPANDVWTDTDNEPDLIVDIDTGFDALRQVASEAGMLGTIWGATESTEETLIEGDTFTITQVGLETTVRNDTTQVTETQEGIKNDLILGISNNSFGEHVTDVQLLTYMRSTDVQFYTSGMLKNMRMYAFFDGVDVTDNVRPLNGAFGEPLYADENGAVAGVFRIPNEDSKRFYVGTRIFRLTNSSINSVDPDELRSYAEAQYHAGGLHQTKQETVLSVGTPEFSTETVERTSIFTEQREMVLSVTNTIMRGDGGDPLAQSFMVKNPDGMFITKLDLYFSAKGETDGIWLNVREMVNGYPGPKILPYGKITKPLSDITTSMDGSVATTFEFESPIYLMGNTEYCFVIGSQDRENRIYASKLGARDLLTGSVISEQPHMGSVFKGQNNRTWNAEQYEDIKFVLYRAEFDIADPMTLQFKHGDDLLHMLGSNPIETEDTTNVIRIHHKNHGFTTGDKIKLNMLSDNWFEVQLQSGNLVKGQTITGTTNSGTAIIKEIEYVSAGVYSVQVSDLTGWFDDDEVFNGSTIYEEYNQSLADAHGITINNTGHLNAVGYFPNGIDNTFNGIPVQDFSQDLTIQDIDTIDSYILNTATNATATGYVGGAGIYVKSNVIGDSLKVNGSIMDIYGDGFWRYNSVKHQGIGSTITDYAAVADVSIQLNKMTELNEPIKIATDLNATTKNAGVETFNVVGEFGSNSDFISPVVNLNSVSAEAISNRIAWNDSTNIDVAPNSTGRFIAETDNVDGVAKAKYVTKVVNLANPANVITVYADVVNYNHSDIEIYYRTLPAESNEGIVTVDWTLLDYTRTVSEHPGDFKELEINIPENNPILPATELEDFKSFQIKFVLRSKNSAKAPKVSKLRCIATT